MLPSTKIAELLEKLEKGIASQTEIDQLNNWYHSFDDSLVEINEEDNLSSLKKRLAYRKSALLKAKKSPPFQLSNWMGRAAIFILLISSLGAYFLFFQQSTPSTISRQQAPKISPIKPGGDRAILTLANGETVILDSTHNGLIGTQGEIKIEKLNNGQLAYRVNGQLYPSTNTLIYNTISTPRGGQYKVTLSDGSKIWLNAESSIRFPVAFTGTQRKVEITGEVYFEIAKDTQRPFIVKTPGSEVEVLGTHFNLNAYDDEGVIRTTLLEGKIKVTAQNNQASQQTLTPGQQSIQEKEKIRVVNNADTEAATAWIKGRFQFKSADLRSILRQIGRWYDVDVEYVGNVDLHFTGQLTRNEEVTKVFEKLELTGEVKFKTEGRKIIVSRFK